MLVHKHSGNWRSSFGPQVKIPCGRTLGLCQEGAPSLQDYIKTKWTLPCKLITGLERMTMHSSGNHDRLRHFLKLDHLLQRQRERENLRELPSVSPLPKCLEQQGLGKNCRQELATSFSSSKWVARTEPTKPTLWLPGSAVEGIWS